MKLAKMTPIALAKRKPVSEDFVANLFKGLVDRSFIFCRNHLRSCRQVFHLQYLKLPASFYLELVLVLAHY